MKKFLLLSLALCCSILVSFAEEITQGEALKLAGYVFKTSRAQTLGKNQKLTLSFAQKGKLQSDKNNHLYYVINRGNDAGFAVIAGDNRVAPVLAYSYTGSLNEEDIQNHPSLNWLFEEYASQIAWAQCNLADKPSSTYKTLAKEKASEPEIIVEPLLEVEKADRTKKLPATISWGQDWPFNKYSPNFRYNGRIYPTVSGCVATGIATVMRWHKWPSHPKGRTSYNWEGSWLSLNFEGKGPENADYDWDQMPAGVTSGGRDRETGKLCTDEQADNIGRLLRDVGYCMKMHYGPAFTGGSGTYLYYAAGTHNVLVNNFDYDKGLKWIKRNSYNRATWYDHVQKELEDYGPIVYVGYSQGGGHCFVLDGFATQDYVHVDWGWNGSENGWYLLDVLEPGSQGVGGGSGGYSMGQEMLRYLKPAGDGIVQNDTIDLFVKELKNIILEQATNQEVSVVIGNKRPKAYSGKIGLAIYKEGDQYTRVLTSTQSFIPAEGEAGVKFKVDLSKEAVGDYRLTVNYAKGELFKVIDDVAILKIVKKGEKKEDAKPVEEQLTIISQPFNLKLKQEAAQKIMVTVGNTSDQVFVGKLAIAIKKGSETSAKVMQILPTSIFGGKQSTVMFSIDLTTKAVGVYKAYLCYKKDGKYVIVDDKEVGSFTLEAKVNPNPNPNPQPTPVDDKVILRVAGNMKVNGTVGKHAKIFVQLYSESPEDYQGVLNLYAHNKTTNKTTLISGGDVKILKYSHPLVTFYTDPGYLTLKSGVYELYVAYKPTKNGKLEYLNVRGDITKTLIGTLTMVGDSEKEETIKAQDISLQTVAFYQGGEFKGNDNAAIIRLDGEVTARVYMKSTHGYKGKVGIFITDKATGNKATYSEYNFERSVSIKPSQSGYVEIKFSPRYYAFSTAYVNISYLNADGKTMSYNPKASIPFTLTYYKVNDTYYTSTSTEPTDGPVIDVTRIPYEAIFPASVVGVSVNPPTDGEQLQDGNVVTNIESATQGETLSLAYEAEQVTVTTPVSATLVICDLKGHTVFKAQVPQGTTAVNVATLDKGTYLAMVAGKTLKFVK